VCSKLGLKFGRCKENVKAVLKDEGVTRPSQQQMNKTIDKLEEEYHPIMFIYKADWQRYGKFLEHMENDLLQCKDPFPKTVVDAYSVLAGWNNRYGTSENKIMDANDGMAFAITSEEENDKKNKKK